MTVNAKWVSVVVVLVCSIPGWAAENPLFTQKKSDPENYNPVEAMATTETICGANDLQHVEFYDGTFSGMGFTEEYVERLNVSVGVIKEQNDETAHGYCSGTMVGRDLFLTASHCVSDESVGHYVAFGYQLNENGSGTRTDQYHSRIVEIVEDGINANDVYEGGLDYAIVRVWDKTAYATRDFYGSYEMPVGWRSVFQSIPNEAAIIQHPGGLQKQLDAGVAIQYGDDITEMVYGDIDTQGGSSGSGILDRFGRLVGVHTTGGCYSNGGVNSGVTMEAILSYSQVLQETIEPAYISNFHVHPYTVSNPVQVNLTSNPNPFVLMSQNLDNTRYLPIFWNKPNDLAMRIQIRVDGGSWNSYALYDQYARVSKLCLTQNRGNGVPPGCENAPAIYGGLIEFRFRLEGNGSTGPWRYMRPIDLYYNS